MTLKTTLFRSSFILLVSLGLHTLEATEDSITTSLPQRFKELKETSFNVPTFKELFLSGHPLNEALYKDIRLTSLETFESTLDAFFSVMNGLLQDSQKWFKGDSFAHQAPSTEENEFVPYAQKLVKTAGSSCLLKGDLHGDIHSLVSSIEHLHELGITTSENPLKINDPSFHIIFLGDYVDRGLWGTEVLLLLMLLKCVNPTQVLLMRGNHEDPHIASLYGFQTEFFAKFSDSSLEDRQRCYRKICAFYEYLPVVLYLGSGTHSHKNFVQCCHGGLEIGYNPQSFLRNPDELLFESIHILRQATESKKLPPFLVRGSRSLPLKHYCSDFRPTSPFQLGFLWNDFVVDPQEISSHREGRGFAFNKDLTKAVLQAASSDDTQVIGVIRAHQHSPYNSDPMMALLLSSQGCASLWNTQKKHLTFSKGTVLTLLLSPDSPHGQPRTSCDPHSAYDGFTYDTSLLLTTGTDLDEWHATVLNNNVYERRNQCREKASTDHQREIQKESAAPGTETWWNWLSSVFGLLW